MIDEAAALWESLSQNHPFVDGNKRTAFASTYVFLLINGVRIGARDEEAQVFVLGLYGAGQFKFENLRVWLSENTEAVLRRCLESEEREPGYQLRLRSRDTYARWKDYSR